MHLTYFFPLPPLWVRHPWVIFRFIWLIWRIFQYIQRDIYLNSQSAESATASLRLLPSAPNLQGHGHSVCSLKFRFIWRIFLWYLQYIHLNLLRVRHWREFSILKNLARSWEIIFYCSSPSQNSRFDRADSRSRLEARDIEDKYLDLASNNEIIKILISSRKKEIIIYIVLLKSCVQ